MPPLGNRAVVFTAWLCYGLGTTTSQVVDVLNGHLQMPVSAGGLHDLWLHMDETGWRTAGDTRWHWCASAKDATFYWIHESRGHNALGEFFTEEFKGGLGHRLLFGVRRGG
jgi:hypothetical protein